MKELGDRMRELAHTDMLEQEILAYGVTIRLTMESGMETRIELISGFGKDEQTFYEVDEETKQLAYQNALAYVKRQQE